MEQPPEQVIAQLTSLVVELRERIAALEDELGTAQQMLAEAAVRDTLTGLYSRRGFLEYANIALQMADRTRRPLALFYVDLDAMKAINDAHGHAAGDEALREVGRTLQACARAADVVARFGGEEFAVILPHTTLEQAQRFAERARGAVAALPLAITASFGAAQLGAQGDVEALLAAADQALYRAKAGGRDRVEAAQALGV